ncbi:TadE/TadG family type IV pilus assembly protein [Sphingomonas sp. 8AM]|uniref:TadE/TadG family type IV pilus assembly protein n=1 Tax=Sphingomonas sp. 8AM TaxID=2653170 RepID=UPI001358A889|nr:pilus assembly protein [Sphingomonas sp. 8AM]
MSFLLSRTLPRLLRDVAGNVAIMAAFAVIPLLAMIGGAIDTSRTYMAYTRLQQACDAGALAGRKAMSNVTRLTDAEKAKASEFFRFNFPAGTYSAEQINAVYDKAADGVVVGRASLSMPTTLMRMFGFGSIPVTTTCQAELNIPNTDVMFVLDVTGSMAATPSGQSTSNQTLTRIYGLKQAVKDFLAALGPGATTGAGRIRYGFVPYAQNVNVGRVIYRLNPSYIAGGAGDENVNFPSRRGEYRRQTCQNSSGGYYNCDYVQWYWTSLSVNTKSWVQTGNQITNPAYWQGNPTGQNDGAPASFAWDGCIREASTVQGIDGSSSLEAPATAYDLQIDLKPNSAATRWKPALSQLQYHNATYNNRLLSVSYSCPQEASPLQQYTGDYNPTSKTSAAFNAYVDTLFPTGKTYHDIGLAWGARFLAPAGIFSATNSDAVAPGGYQVSRHIVFMTDGQLDTEGTISDAWGVNWMMDKVQPDNAVAPADASEDRIYASHLRRTQIICNEMKKRGFIIWIVGFGTEGLSQELKECATDPDHWSIASDTTALRRSFAKIAQTIGGLRLS